MKQIILFILICLYCVSAQADTTVVVVGQPTGAAASSIPAATAHWLLNNNLTSVTSHNGTSSAMEYSTTRIEGTHAGQFSSGHYFYVADHTDFDPGAGAYSISMWIYAGWLGEEQALISKTEWNDGNPLGYRVIFESTDSYNMRIIHNASAIVDTNWTPTVETWYHIVIAFTPSATNEMQVWVSSSSGTFGDAINGTTYNQDTDPTDNTGSFEVGYADIDALPIYGNIDDIRWWKVTALNAT